MSVNTLVLSKNVKEYRSRKPQYSPYYQCIEDNYEMFERVYERKYQSKYGYFRPIVTKVIYQYLDCGILHNGFARVKCRNCKHEYLLAFSCKRRHFCPSCHAKRVAAFGEFACSNVLKNVPHRHFVFSIPKIIRIYFLFDRALLKDLARIAWEVLSCYYKNSVSKEGTTPAAICSIQTFGDMLGYNPHLHILCADGGFGERGIFYAAADLDGPALEPLFRHKILSMLKRRGLITDRVIELISNWRHSGFNVYCGDRIYPRDGQSMENISRYIIRASFSTERLNYISEDSRVIYKSKTGNDTKEFEALDFIASITSHIPNRNEQTVRYLGYYSNVSRGKRKKQGSCQSDYVIENEEYSKSCSKSWARLIKKIYEVDPLLCPKCGGSMRIIAFIEDDKVIRKILDWLGIDEFRRDRPPPKRFQAADLFDDFSQDDYINADYSDF
jgi:Zn finger protein HypA/HybF involved in hydrogenase expression